MPRLSVLLLASTLAAGPLTGAMAQATQPAPSAPVAAPAKPDAPSPEDVRAAGDRVAFFEARLAALHAGLTLTADQERLWPPVEQAIRQFVKVREDLRDKRSDALQDRADGESEDDVDYVTALRRYADNQAERALALKAVADAATPLYAALTDDQRHRVPLLLREMSPHHRMGQPTREGVGERMDAPAHRGWRHDGDDVNQHRGGMYGDTGTHQRWDRGTDDDEE